MLLVVLATGAQTIYFMRVYQVPPRFFSFFSPAFSASRSAPTANRRRPGVEPSLGVPPNPPISVWPLGVHRRHARPKNAKNRPEVSGKKRGYQRTGTRRSAPVPTLDSGAWEAHETLFF